MSETATAATIVALPLASLPALKHPLEGGTFVGVITLPDGTPHAVVKLDAKTDGRLTWKKAVAWAKEAGGQLPSRAIAALMFSVAKDLFAPDWYWTSEPACDRYAWSFYFGDGGQTSYYQSSEGCAVAVRLIPLVS